MIEAAEFIEAARARGLRHYTGVPCSFMTPFIDAAIADADLEYRVAANEGDAVALAAGWTLGGRGAVVMMQNSGLGNAVNPITSLLQTFRIPVLLLVSWRGQPGVQDEPQHELMGRATPAMLEAIEVPWEPFPEEAAGVAAVLERACAYMQSESRPYALVMRKGAVAPSAAPARRASERAPAREPLAPDYRAGAQRRPTRADVLRYLIEHGGARDTILIATTGYTGRELYALGDRPAHLYMVGSMGCAAALGLGLADARPDLRVIVIDGDGAALMRMGNFATVGAYAGGNLLHLVLDNEVHESTGAQATVSPGVSFAQVALACGYQRAWEGDHLGLLQQALDAVEGAGPACVHLKIRPGVLPDLPRPAITPAQVARRLMEHIGAFAPAQAAAPAGRSASGAG